MHSELEFSIWLGKLRGLAHNLLGPVSRRADTSDLRQDVLVQLLEQGDDLLSVNTGYLKVAAKGHAAKTTLFHKRECRSVLREVPLNDVESREASPAEVLQQRETLARLAEAVGHLSTKDQRLVFLRFRRRLSYARIADELGETERVVRSAMDRIVRTLAESLGEDAG